MPGVQKVPQLIICTASKQSVMKVLTFVPIKQGTVFLYSSIRRTEQSLQQ